MRRRQPSKILERPPHKVPPATWHLDPDIEAMEGEGPLTREQLRAFFEDGFLFIPEHFDMSAIKRVEDDVDQMIDNLAQRLFDAGKIKELYTGLDWTSRLLRMRADFPDAPLILIKGGVLPTALQALFSDARVLDMARQLGVGPGVALNPAWNLRAKMPSHEETVVPWHQDNSYWEPRIWGDQVLTVWVALVDATEENGCMQMVRGGHKSGRTATHTIGTTTSTWYTELSEETCAKDLMGKATLEEADKVAVPAKAGSILIFPGTTPHRSLNSTAENIRWSADFRLHKAVRPDGPGRGADLDWFYGLKESLLLRDGGGGGNPDFLPDWPSWAKVDRTEVQDTAVGLDAKESFDPVIVGPWMDLWDIEADAREPRFDGDTRPNKHVERYLATPEEKRNIDGYVKSGNW